MSDRTDFGITRARRQRAASDLDAIAVQIRREVDAAENDFRSAVVHGVRAGELLIDAKSRVKHGEWLPWLEANCPLGEREAQNYMRLARNPQRVADLPSVREAIALLAEPKDPERVPLEEARERQRTTREFFAELEPILQAAPRPLSRDAAEHVTEQFRKGHAAVFTCINDLYDLRTHEALGCSWTEYVDRYLIDVANLPPDMPAWMYVQFREWCLDVEAAS